jgi:hypothetical protein
MQCIFLEGCNAFLNLLDTWNLQALGICELIYFTCYHLVMQLLTIQILYSVAFVAL